MKARRKPKRRYDSNRRQAQARDTRRQVVEAARDLFFERGYAGTTIDAIAKKAGVSNQTIYAIFGNKLKILSFLMDISVGGDDQPMRLLERPEPQAVLHSTDQRQQLRMFSQGIAEILGRASPLFEIMRSAAKTEPKIANLLRHLLDERLQNMAIFVEHLAANGPLREGLDAAQASEIVWTVASPEVYRLLTLDRGWSGEVYAIWLADTLITLLLR
ncbi:MAG: helix-turn-helix domain-containing protein [Anaerolineales bacterium]